MNRKKEELQTLNKLETKFKIQKRMKEKTVPLSSSNSGQNNLTMLLGVDVIKNNKHDDQNDLSHEMAMIKDKHLENTEKRKLQRKEKRNSGKQIF